MCQLPKSSYFHKVYNLDNLGSIFFFNHPLMYHLFKNVFSIIIFIPIFILVPKPKACLATGRGLQSKGMRVGQLADFKVDTCKAGPGNLEVLIRDPSESINSPQSI